jgi:hypothetical protein
VLVIHLVSRCDGERNCRQKQAVTSKDSRSDRRNIRN